MGKLSVVGSQSQTSGPWVYAKAGLLPPTVAHSDLGQHQRFTYRLRREKSALQNDPRRWFDRPQGARSIRRDCDLKNSVRYHY